MCCLLHVTSHFKYGLLACGHAIIKIYTEPIGHQDDTVSSPYLHNVHCGQFACKSVYNLSYTLHIPFYNIKQLVKFHFTPNLQYESVWFAYDPSISDLYYVFPPSLLVISDCCNVL